ncbi:hypothetical protein ACH4VX_06985 [Streptomyces sp. NPDC020731]|uniref:hypothetical protein n=1 Tax=Streptomyces sp. NPDC020731 TaxID=3365085 RepID=UPI003798A930
MATRVLIDRWGFALLLRGHRPRAVEGERFDEYLIGEREYLRFLTITQQAEPRTGILLLLESIQRTQGKSPSITSALSALLNPEQVQELYGIPVALSRLPEPTLGLLPATCHRFGLQESEAESVLLALQEEVAFLTCYRSLAVRRWMWMALSKHKIHKLDLDHGCPRLKKAGPPPRGSGPG